MLFYSCLEGSGRSTVKTFQFLGRGNPFIVPSIIFLFLQLLLARCSKSVEGVNNGIDGAAIRSSLANKGGIRGDGEGFEIPGEFRFLGSGAAGGDTRSATDRIANSFTKLCIYTPAPSLIVLISKDAR